MRGLADIGLAGGSTLVARALGFVTVVALAHELPPSGFARYLVYLSLTLVLGTAADGGFVTVVGRIASRMGRDPSYDLSYLAYLRRRHVWVGVTLIASVAAALHLAAIDWLLPFATAGAAAHAQSETCIGEDAGGGHFSRAAQLRLITAALSVVLSVGLAAVWHTAAAPLAGFTLARLLPVLPSLRSPPIDRINVAREHPGLTWRGALPIGLSAVVAVAYVRTGMLLLGAFQVRASLVALYGVLLNVVFAFHLVSAAVTHVVFQRAARGGRATAARLRERTTPVAWAVVSVAVACFLALAPCILRIFGPHYAALRGLAPLCVVVVPFSVTQLAMGTLMACDLERLALKLRTAALGATVVLTSVLIAAHGARGAALATLGVEVALALASSWYCSRAGLGATRAMALVILLPSSLVALAGGGRIALVAALLAPVAWLFAFDRYALRTEALQMARLLTAKGWRGAQRLRRPSGRQQRTVEHVPPR